MVDISPENTARMLDGVTEGPWTVGEYNDTLGYDCMTGGVRVGRFVLDGADYGQMRCSPENKTPPSGMMEDARFIAWAREAVPALAARVAELEARSEAWMNRCMHETSARLAAEAEAAAMREENARLRTDCAILLAQIDATEDTHGVGPEDEDAALVAQIRAALTTPPGGLT